MYRWYIHDPIRFKKKIKWTIEHGNANNFENDYSSGTSYHKMSYHHKEMCFSFPEEQKCCFYRTPLNLVR